MIDVESEELESSSSGLLVQCDRCEEKDKREVGTRGEGKEPRLNIWGVDHGHHLRASSAVFAGEFT